MQTLLSINDFYDWVGLSDKVQYDDLSHFVLQAQTGYLRPILCEGQYNALIDAWENDDFTNLENDLMQYVRPFLVFMAYTLYLKQNGLINTATGFKVTIDPQGTTEPLTDARMEAIRRDYREQADFYKNDLIQFLKRKKDNYPLWKNSDCACVDQGVAVYMMGVKSKEQARSKEPYLRITKNGSRKS